MTHAPSDAVFYLDTSALVKRYVVIRREIVERAVDLTTRHKLRGYDAVQLAAALELKRLLLSAQLAPPTFVAADDDLLAAAQSEGLQVANPNEL